MKLCTFFIQKNKVFGSLLSFLKVKRRFTERFFKSFIFKDEPSQLPEANLNGLFFKLLLGKICNLFINRKKL